MTTPARRLWRVGLFTDWSDEQLSTCSAAFESAHGEGAFGSEVDKTVGRELRAEAMRRGVRLDAAYNGDPQDPEGWMSYLLDH